MKGVPILVYHQVVDEDFDLNNVPVGDRSYYLRREAFAQQMEYLFHQGFKTLTLRDFFGFIKGDIQLPSKSIVLTFDDGHISNYTHVYPILRRFNFKATFFLIVEKIDKLQVLKWIQIAQMVDNGLEIGSHTVTHPFLSDLKEEKVLWELKRSKEILETRLKKEIKDIQSKCAHLEYSLKFDGDGKSLRKICKDCEQIVGYPTEQELKDNGFI